MRVLVFVVMGVLAWSGTPSACPDQWTNPPAAIPDGSAASRVSQGYRAADAQDWPGAEAAFLEAVRLEPSMPEAWNGLGYALRHQQRYDESVKSYREALRLRPDYPQALQYLGEAYVQMGRVEDARRVLEQLKSLSPADAEKLARRIDQNGR